MTQREFRMTKPKGTGGGSFRSRLAQLRAKAAGDCRTPRRWRAHRAQREITPNSWRMKFEKRPMKTKKLSQIKPQKFRLCDLRGCGYKGRLPWIRMVWLQAKASAFDRQRRDRASRLPFC